MASVRQGRMKAIAIAQLLLPITLAVAQTNQMTLKQKMETIIIPSIECRNSSGPELLSLLTEMAGQPIDHNPFLPCLGGLVATNKAVHTTRTILAWEDGTPIETPPITCEYRRISLYEALEKITVRLGVTFTFQNDELFLFKDGKRILKKEIVEQGDRD